MKHVQFETGNGEIVNAALDKTGLFCDKKNCKNFYIHPENSPVGNPACKKFKRLRSYDLPGKILIVKAQAYPACQLAAQETKQ